MIHSAILNSDQRVCSVAWTLDGEQTTLCTYIGSEPLFYFNEDVPEEDDNLVEVLFTKEESDIILSVYNDIVNGSDETKIY